MHALNFTVADGFDVLIVAMVVYATLRFLHADRHYFVLLTGIIIVSVYLAAHKFDLLLTERLFNVGMVACGIVLALAFQEDIRRSVHRLGNWRPFRMGAIHSDDYLRALADFAFQCAEKKIGALVVIKGRDQIESHLSRGLALSGPVHSALLHSIFDPHSPGHDGAVIIEDGQIVQMSAHLPLATIAGKQTCTGTRHRAALGLSELSDATVVVVSEERGIVSVVHASRITETRTHDDFLRLLSPLRDTSNSRSKWSFIPKLFDHLLLKAAALIVATSAWLILASHDDVVTRTFVVPIEYFNIPSSLTLDADAPDTARIALTGRIPEFAMLETKSLDISIDLNHAKAGPTDIRLTTDNCHRPSVFQVDQILPKYLHLNLVSREENYPRPMR